MQSFRISWTKRHATTEQIDKGIGDTRAAISNGYADAAAELGLATAGHTDLLQLASYSSHKQTAYVQLFAAIARRIARAAMYTHLARERREAEKASVSGASHVPIPSLPPRQISTRPGILY